MKKYIIWFLLLAILVAALGYVGRGLLFTREGVTETVIDTERNVIPIKEKEMERVLKSIGTVSSSADGLKLSIPSSSKDKIAAEQLLRDEKAYGVHIENNTEQFVITMSKGPGSVVLVPVPTFIALVDRGYFKTGKK